MFTDHTPGYGSAAKYIAATIKGIICDSSVYNLNSVTVVEIMGRHTGWLAGAASLAAGADCNGPDMILLPERAFDEKAFLAKVSQLEKERHTLVIAVSEGVKNKVSSCAILYLDLVQWMHLVIRLHFPVRLVTLQI